MDFVTILGLFAAILTTSSFLPQTIQTWKTKKTKDISLPMYVALVLGVFLWLIYGIVINSLPIIGANIITLILSSCILILKIRHG